MKILWLGKRYYTNQDALEEHFGRMYQLPKYWQQAGQSVRLWLVDYHTHKTKQENDAGMEVISTPLISFRIIWEILRILTMGQVKCIVASGDCYLGYLGWLLSKLSGATFIFDVYDKYDEFKGYQRFKCFNLFPFLLRHADGLMFASYVLAKAVHGDTDGPFHVAPNGIDPALFKPHDILECRRALGLRNDITYIGYFGSMEPDRGITDLIDALALLRAAGMPAELLLAGKVDVDIFLNRPWIHYFGTVSHSQVPQLLNACNVLAIPYRTGPLMDMISSCKVSEYLACQRPLIATRTPNFLDNFPTQAKTLGQALCNAGDPHDMARALAYQIQASVPPPPVQDMTWEIIADNALAWLIELIPIVGTGRN